LQKKGFKEESMTKVRLYALGTSTTLESNKSDLSYKYGQEQQRVNAYQVEHALEAKVTAAAIHGGPDGIESLVSEADYIAICDAIWAAVGDIMVDTSRPIILTTSSARAALRSLIAPELPDLPVVARSELRPEIHVQPIATIALPISGGMA
jgi:type III secretory pathway component EscV